jgi:hypothetical protein
MHRCSTFLAVLAVGLAIGLGPCPTPARADTITYRLSTTTGLPVPDKDIDQPQIIATVTAPGLIVPPKTADGNEGSPLTILPDSTGFDPSQLVVALKQDTSAAGQNKQDFGLVFFGSGLAANAMLHFALNVNSALANDPSLLQLTSPTSGFTLTAAPDTDSGTGTGTGTGTNSGTDGGSSPNVPEPLSIVVWSTLAGTGLLRVRAMRRARRLADTQDN